jgi:glucose-1-phosphate thymidylyltransferase
MKGIILAGGTGSRLSPLTKVTNKHLLPVGRKPMIMHPLGKLVEAGIMDVMIITGVEHAGAIVGLLGSGREHGCKITYRIQDEAGGIAQALGLAEDFAAGGRCCVILGDNIFSDQLAPFAATYSAMPSGAMILLKRVPDPGRYGVAEIGPGGEVMSIEEKPTAPKSDMAVTGVYFYDQTAFHVIKGLLPSARGELEVTDINNYYLKINKLRYMEISGGWTDAGTFSSLAKANEMMGGLP